MTTNVYGLDQDKPFPLNEWFDDGFSMCPSQLYCHVQDDNGKDYILYLRWRHGDPWTGDIVEGANTRKSMRDNIDGWTEDVLIGEYTHDDYQQACDELMKRWKELHYDI